MQLLIACQNKMIVTNLLRCLVKKKLYFIFGSFFYQGQKNGIIFSDIRVLNYTSKLR